MTKMDLVKEGSEKVGDTIEFFRSLIKSEKDGKIYTKKEKYGHIVPYLYK